MTHAPLLATLALAAAFVATACGPADRVLSIGVEGGAGAGEVHVGDRVRVRATLAEATAGTASPRVVTNLVDCAWRAKPIGIASIAPGANAADPYVTVTFLKEGDATIWATWERLESANEIVTSVRAR